MTKKKAIEIFKFMLKSGKGTIDYWNGTIAEQRTAIDMAIKALEQQPSDDCVSREGARQFLYEEIDRLNNDELYDIFSKIIDDMYNELPPVTPTHGTCKDCEQLGVMDCGYYCKLNHWNKISTESNYGGMGDFYCADYEKRGRENE